MTAQAAAIAPIAGPRPRAGVFLGFRTLFQKELTEWARGRGALVIAGISILGAIFTTVIPFITPKGQGPVLSMDPTANVLLGWGGLTAAVVALLATMTLISGERDRGTLAWILSKPVSPVSVIAAKFSAAMLVYGTLAVIVPLAVSAGVATIVYGSVPDLGTVAAFAILYLTVPAFYIALTITLGTFVKSTAGVAGIGFAVLLAPLLIGGVLPSFNDVSPTAIGAWAMATATGHPTSALALVGWLATMAIFAVAARVVINRQEF